MLIDRDTRCALVLLCLTALSVPQHAQRGKHFPVQSLRERLSAEARANGCNSSAAVYAPRS